MDSRLEADLVVEAIREFAETLMPRDREVMHKFARYVQAQEFFREFERQEKQREVDRHLWNEQLDAGTKARRRLRGQ